MGKSKEENNKGGGEGREKEKKEPAKDNYLYYVMHI